MFSSRQRRRSSPEPESPLSSVSCGTPETGRRRRRVPDADHFSPAATAASSNNGGATILPLRSTSSKKPPSQLPTFQAGNTCNNFLLGGQFYPGKDKKRKHLRKRTIWHRIFCSSPWRVCVSVLLFTYVAVWYVMVPSTNILLDYGRTLSGGRHGFMDLSSLSVPSIKQQRIDAMKLRTERDRLQYSSDRRHDKRMKVLEQIVPDWYRPNDGAKPLNKKNALVDANDKSHGPDGVSLRQRKKRRSRARRPDSSEEEIQQRGTRHHLLKVVATDSAGTVANVASIGRKTANEHEHIQHSGGDKSDVTAASNTTTRPDRNKLLPRTLQNMDTFPAKSNCPADLLSTDIKTTLVIQSSLERLWILKETCRRWSSPIVVAIHVPHGTVDEHPSIVEAKQACPQLTAVLLRASKDATPWAYPVNRLRNMALDAVQTSHILVTDIDFVPSMNLDETIWITITQQEPLVKNASAHREAMIVPAFERLPPTPCTEEHDCSAYLRKNSSFIPQTLQDLRSCTATKNCTVFQRSNNWEGHSSTRSDSWLKGDWYEVEEVNTAMATNSTGHVQLRSKRIRAIKCFDSLRYEPYVVLRWCPVSAAATSTANNDMSSTSPVAPYYDERFYGYGKNKIQLISHLRFMGYHFSVLPKGFITHNPHMESAAKATWNNVQENKLHQEMDALYPDFLEELWNKYRAGTHYIVQQCKRHKKN